jgi:bacillithiol system protein YtxJ
MAIERIPDEKALEVAFKSELAILFKHSPVCPASAVAMEEVENFTRTHPDVPLYVVDVRGQRPLSQKTAAYFGVTHESPQVILVRNGAAVWHASHYGITAAKLSSALSTFGS